MAEIKADVWATIKDAMGTYPKLKLAVVAIALGLFIAWFIVKVLM